MGQSLAERIADRIRRKIESGELAAEARLPTYEQLGAQYEADKNTAARAIGILREEQWVYTIQGKGTYVLAPAKRESAESDAALISAITGQLDSLTTHVNDLEARLKQLEAREK